MGMDEIKTLNVQISAVTTHPRFRNPRGRIVNTIDLQESVKADGVLQPILVEPNGDGYHLLGGERRLTAARLVGLEVIPAVIHEPKDDRERLRIIAASNMNEDVPFLVLDEGGETVGGKAYLVKEMFAAKMPRFEIAPLVGLTADAVGACVALEKDLAEVRLAVADGRLALTVYSLMKHKPVDFKLFVCSKRGQITASYVRDCVKNWKKIKEKLTAEDGTDDTSEPEEVVRQVTAERQVRPVAQLLQRALASLREIEEVEPQQYFILEEIEIEMGRLL